jgi:hypothetical protein
MRHHRGLAASPGVLGILLVGEEDEALSFARPLTTDPWPALIHNRGRLSHEGVITQLLEHEFRKICA